MTGSILAMVRGVPIPRSRSGALTPFLISSSRSRRSLNPASIGIHGYRNHTFTPITSLLHRHYSILNNRVSLQSKQQQLVSLPPLFTSQHQHQHRFKSSLSKQLIKPSKSDSKSSSSSSNDNTNSRKKKRSRQEIWVDLKQIIELARDEYKLLGAAIALLFISSAVTMSVPFSMGRIIDLVISSLKLEASEKKDTKDESVSTTTETNLANFLPTFTGSSSSASSSLSDTLALPLPKLFGILIGVFALGATANAGRVILMKYAGERIVTRLRTRLFSSIIRQDLEFFDKNRTGELISRLSSDTVIIGKTITGNLSDGLRALASAGMGVSMMMYMSPQLTMIMLSIVPPIALSAVFYGRYVKDLSRKTQDALGDATKVTEEKLAHIRTVRAFSQEHSEITRYSNQVERVFGLSVKEAFASGAFFGGMGLSGNMTLLALLWFGGNLVQEGVLSVGQLTSFFIYTAYVGSSTIGLSSFYSELMKGAGASSRVFELLSLKPVIEDIESTIPKRTIPNLQGRLEFRNVHFEYPTRPDSVIFNDLNLRIEPGSNVAIVGHSGSGKSTIANMLLRFYDPRVGSILVDDVELKELELSWWRSQIGYVSQDPIMFSGTVVDNLRYGRPDATLEEVEDALKKAYAWDFVTEWKDGLLTEVGELGIKISGGQRQRLAIARAILQKPHILILDEATSALDETNNSLVSSALDALVHSKRCTTITIAHRLSTILKADYIVMVEDGRIVEIGTYEELMDKGIEEGRFCRMMEGQKA